MPRKPKAWEDEEEEEKVWGKGVTEGGKQAGREKGREGEGELPQLPRLHTTYDRAAPLSRFSRHHLSRTYIQR